MTDSETRSAHDGVGAQLAYRSKTDLVTEYLRNELQAGRPGPGERLVLARVAAALGVSKIPVREAVTQLVGEGLLIQRPNVGPVVPAFTAHEVLETALLRVAVENVAIDSAVPLHTADTLAPIRDLLAEMSSSAADFPALNVRFHLAIIDTSPFREVVRTAHALLERAQRYAIVRNVPGYQDVAHQEHRRLLEVLEERDTKQLKVLNEQHVLRAARELTDHIR